MERLLLFVASFILIACETSTKTNAVNDAEIKLKAKQFADSITEESTRRVMFDTVGVANCPIKVLKARLVEKEYSSYKDISLTFKNVGDKTIEGIKFKWYGENVFGDPADMGSYGLSKGFGGGFMDKKLRPGRTITLEWDISSRDAKKVVMAWPYEIVFEDETKWESSYKD